MVESEEEVSFPLKKEKMANLSDFKKSCSEDKNVMITQEQLTDIVSKNCHYCNLSNDNGLFVIGVDCKYYQLDYVPGNCLPACLGCSTLKGTIPYQVFINNYCLPQHGKNSLWDNEEEREQRERKEFQSLSLKELN